MAGTYEAIVEFMERYFKDFTAYGQDPENQHKMDKYFTPDLEFNAYSEGLEGASNRKEFYELSTHPEIQETLFPGLLIVDDRKKIASALVKTQLKHKQTGEVKVFAWFSCIYELEVDKSDDIRIKRMSFFFEYKKETTDVHRVLHPN